MDAAMYKKNTNACKERMVSVDKGNKCSAAQQFDRWRNVSAQIADRKWKQSQILVNTNSVFCEGFKRNNIYPAQNDNKWWFRQGGLKVSL